MKEIIERLLRSWFAQMVRKYPWLRVRFEFDERCGVFLVSFSPDAQIEKSDDFNKDAMQFADELNASYGIDAPLFTDEEKLFRLSANAETICSEKHVPLNAHVAMAQYVACQ